MERKRCPHCDKICYSVSKKGIWICPRCGVDISKEPVLAVDSYKASVLPFNRSVDDVSMFN